MNNKTSKTKTDITDELKINEAHQSIYKFRFSFWLKVSIAAISIFILSIIVNFPLKTLILSQSEKILRTQTTCPINFERVEFSWFLPTLAVIQPEISGVCFGPNIADLPLNQLNIKLTRPTFFPPGVQFKIEIQRKSNKLDIVTSIGPSGQFIAIKNGKIDGELISHITGKDIIQGDINLELRADLGSKTLKELALHIKSTNLYIPGQNTPLIRTPALDIGNLSLKGKLEDGKEFLIDEMIIGKSDSPIKTDFKGSVQVNSYNMMFSTYNVRGEMRIADDLLNREELALLKMLLSGRNQTDGAYRLELKGPLNGIPQANFL